MDKIYEIFKQYKYKLLFIYMFMLLTELSILIFHKKGETDHQRAEKSYFHINKTYLDGKAKIL